MRDNDDKLIWEAFGLRNPMKGIFTTDLYVIWYEEYTTSVRGAVDTVWERYWEPLANKVGKDDIPKVMMKRLFTKEEADNIDFEQIDNYTGKSAINKVIFKGDNVTKKQTAGHRAGGDIIYYFNKRLIDGRISPGQQDLYITRGDWMEEHIDWTSTGRAKSALRRLR